MGADIEVKGNRAIVHGRTPLTGTEVTAHDLRSGIALVLAGLAAEGRDHDRVRDTSSTAATHISPSVCRLSGRMSGERFQHH